MVPNIKVENNGAWQTSPSQTKGTASNFSNLSDQHDFKLQHPKKTFQPIPFIQESEMPVNMPNWAKFLMAKLNNLNTNIEFISSQASEAM